MKVFLFSLLIAGGHVLPPALGMLMGDDSKPQTRGTLQNVAADVEKNTKVLAGQPKSDCPPFVKQMQAAAEVALQNEAELNKVKCAPEPEGDPIKALEAQEEAALDDIPAVGVGLSPVADPVQSMGLQPAARSATACKAKKDSEKAEVFAKDAFKAEVEAKKKVQVAALKKKRAIAAKVDAMKLYKVAATKANEKAKCKKDSSDKLEEEQQGVASGPAAQENAKEAADARNKVEDARAARVKAQKIEKVSSGQSSAITETLKEAGDLKVKADAEAQAAAAEMVRIAKDAKDSMAKVEGCNANCN